MMILWPPEITRGNNGVRPGNSTPMVDRLHIRTLIEILAVAHADKNLAMVVERVQIARVDDDLYNPRMRADMRRMDCVNRQNVFKARHARSPEFPPPSPGYAATRRLHGSLYRRHRNGCPVGYVGISATPQRVLREPY